MEPKRPIQLTDHSFWAFIRNHPDDLFVVFTSQQRRFLWDSDRAIREFLAFRYHIKPHQAFSHTALVWWEDDKPMMYHQTTPKYKRNQWGTRAKNVAFWVEDEKVVSIAKKRARSFYKHNRHYSYGQLITLILTELSFGLIPVPIREGMVCSEAVARELSFYDGSSERFYNEVDPYSLYLNIKARGYREFNVSKD